MKFYAVIFSLLLYVIQPLWAVDQRSYVSSHPSDGRFPLSTSDRVAPLVVSAEDYSGVQTVARHLQADIKQVTAREPEIILDSIPPAKHVVLIGTIGKSPFINELIRAKKLNVAGIAGRWDTFVLQVVEQPMPGVEKALIIAGSNKRGTLYGMFDLSAHIGVSPWTWWADVPARQQSELYILPGRHTAGEPAVKYRGIFLNDEEPALGRWAVANYGGFTAPFYEKLFMLMLRLKANYLWPAMWWASFNSDDPRNPELADEYGIVMGTTHHEPMNRAHAEWRASGTGDWNYETNADTLRQFWRDGIKRMGDYETIVTLAMRGDGDMAMTEETNIALLERIVADQRDILADVTGKDVTTIPQLWALYKEVQDYYDKGMRVPDDVTLLLCDDNWGNLRKLPLLTDKPRAGGYGIYYHFDYVGGPRNYKWLNTNQIERVWEQMHLAYAYGVDRIWLVNVGDLKPMELPIEFFLDYAWNPESWPADRLPEYTRLWAEKQFGSAYAIEIAALLNGYTKFNSRRKPELLSSETYSLIYYREFETVVSDYYHLTKQAETIYEKLVPDMRDAFYQLVLHPVKACANLNDLYFTVAKNRLYAKQGRGLTNDLAQKAQVLFEKDSTLSHYYNNVLSGGKWFHMMDQTHISYTYWQQPPKDVVPRVDYIHLPDTAELGVTIEGSEKWWPGDSSKAELPMFDSLNKQSFCIEIYNRGSKPFDYSVTAQESWLNLLPATGTISTQERVEVSVDWEKVPPGEFNVPLTISGANTKVVVYARVNKLSVEKQSMMRGFIERNGHIAIEATHYSRKVDVAPVRWCLIPNLGRTGSAITPSPVTVASQTPGEVCPRLEYDIFLLSSGDITVHLFVSPTLNFHNNQGLRFAVSIDDNPPKTINIHENFAFQDWEQAVRCNIIKAVSQHVIAEAGAHVLKFWMIDPGIVLQKIVIDAGGLQASYLGPPESNVAQPAVSANR
ncbi:glycosyl hydrolase [candidate division KSB1 bacterium]|nr:glycosyl hydrolase 115 family protein [candidate division KSB1 bacterium]RQW05533.1 MAG: glycosyl hydrolase [candidate division KSB1 bacterium]